MFAGGLVPNRGLSQVIAALGLLRRRGLSVPLALAGPVEESYLRSLLDEAAREGIRELVTYHGMLSKAETRNLQLRSSIGLVTYLPVGNNVAGMPNKLVECMELGVPVVYSDFATYREVADGASPAGIAVDPTQPGPIAEAIERLVRSPETARAMGEAGRRAVRERFNWDVERTDSWKSTIRS